jgi:hypothetical protein
MMAYRGWEVHVALSQKGSDQYPASMQVVSRLSRNRNGEVPSAISAGAKIDQ